MKISENQLLNIIKESVKRNLKEAYGESEDVETENELDCESIATAFFTALKYDNSQYVIKEIHDHCGIEVMFQENWFYKPFEKAIYFLGGESFTVYLPNNQMTKIPIDPKNRGYMIRMILDAQVFSDEEIGNTLTRHD